MDSPPDIIRPQLATLVDRPPVGPNWSYEIKFDGYRMLCRIDNGAVTLFTRNGHDWTERMPALAGALAALPVRQAWIDGEVVALNKADIPDFSALQNAFARRRTAGLTFFAFDIMFQDGRDLRQVRLDERQAALRQLLSGVDDAHLRLSNTFTQGVESLLDSACRMGLEGLIGKRVDRSYTEGRSPDWIKVKCLQRQEFVVGGISRSAGAATGFRSLLLGVYERDGGFRFTGSVKATLRPTQMRELHARLESVDEPPFFNPPKPERGRTLVWMRPQLVVEVSFLEWTSSGEIRHGVLKALREDKEAGDVHEEKPVATRATSKRTGPSSRVRGPTITNASRIVDPSTGLTKADVARYFDVVADYLLPHIKDRPLMLVRAPDGIDGEMFYQKHTEGKRLRAVTQLPESMHPGHAPLLVANTREALLELAQLNTIEIHAWNATAPDLDHPDRFILDLDPDPQLDWSVMVEAATLTRVVLDELGLQSHCKTSGGKGVHIIVPLAPIHTWQEVKGFSHAIARHLAKIIPQRFSAVSGARNRIGKVFVDYLRNGKGATTAIALSPRARPGLPVSMPVRWDELLELSGAADWNVVTGIAEAGLKSSDKPSGTFQQEISDKMRRSVLAAG
ncbi:DNA ligase D [Paraburkholderia sp. SARCC-3016]|uniref:DNA ligase D n=1 Tax=Paraburkholderia sp. SARCC-3016 TaxID=3058611 RepID=UPI002808DF60|nr:DNA ligase D [Paraburkholderia sp. SARCC-3016]MDQ7979900.1 DNA ligase D [Paraburkholderia sp. SARCC-3016]